MSRSSRLNKSAFTLIELMMVMAIIAVLAVIGYGAYMKYYRRAENAVCMDRMKNIHQALANYVTSNQNWPQLPKTLDEADEEQHWEWWAKTMETYGVPEKEWLCPTDERQRKVDYAKEGKKRDKYEGSYVPTNFEEGSDTPFKWRQPWLVERGDFHGYGMNVIYPDGSIKPFLGPGSSK